MSIAAVRVPILQVKTAIGASSQYSQAKAQETAELAKQEEEEQAVIAKLKARDAEVRAHEAAHQAAGSGLTGGATYTYQTGPDGKRYAIGGEVSIDLSTESDPEANISKMQRVKSAALAPADPSGQDRAVARAAQMEIQNSQRELREETASGAPGKAAAAYAANAGGKPAPGETIQTRA